MTKRKRSRNICIRLSEKEYSDLQNLCAQTEARNMSVFIRTALRHTMRAVVSVLDARETLDAGLSEIQREIVDVKKKLDSLEEGMRKYLSAHQRSKDRSGRAMQNDD